MNSWPRSLRTLWSPPSRWETIESHERQKNFSSQISWRVFFFQRGCNEEFFFFFLFFFWIGKTRGSVSILSHAKSRSSKPSRHVAPFLFFFFFTKRPINVCGRSFPVHSSPCPDSVPIFVPFFVLTSLSLSHAPCPTEFHCSNVGSNSMCSSYRGGRGTCTCRRSQGRDCEFSIIVGNWKLIDLNFYLIIIVMFRCQILEYFYRSNRSLCKVHEICKKSWQRSNLRAMIISISQSGYYITYSTRFQRSVSISYSKSIFNGYQLIES